MKIQVKLLNTTFQNRIGTLIGETDKYFIVSLQNKETLDRFTRNFSKKTLKAVRCPLIIENFINHNN